MTTAGDNGPTVDEPSGTSAAGSSAPDLSGDAVLDGSDAVAWARLEDQLAWYDAKSLIYRRSYTYLKVLQLMAGAAIPVVAGVHAAVWVTGGLGALVVVLEGIQQLGQYHANWIQYRSTAEALKHEKFLYLSDAGPYNGVPRSSRLLAERIESLVSQEHAKWAAGQEGVTRRRDAARDTPV